MAICEKRSLNEDEFERCFTGNNHGMGYAFWDGEKVTLSKGFMLIEEAWEAYQKIPFPHVVHFRLASAGGVKPELTHPFICTPESPLELDWSGDEAVLFHNGTISDWKSLLISAMISNRVIPKGAMSDTRTVAILAGILGDDVFELWSGSKWAMVDKTGCKYFGTWVEGDDGILYSNSGWEPRKKWTSPVTTFGRQGYWNTDPFQESQTSIAVRNGYGKSCIDCVHYKLNMVCEKKGALKDMHACTEFEYLPPLPGVKGKGKEAPIGKSCATCAYYYGGYKCSKVGEMQNLTPCANYKVRGQQGSDPYAGKSLLTCEDCQHYLLNYRCSLHGKLKDLIRCRKDFLLKDSLLEDGEEGEKEIPPYLRVGQKKTSKKELRKERKERKVHSGVVNNRQKELNS